jgi:hypothetical protein
MAIVDWTIKSVWETPNFFGQIENNSITQFNDKKIGQPKIFDHFWSWKLVWLQFFNHQKKW